MKIITATIIALLLMVAPAAAKAPWVSETHAEYVITSESGIGLESVLCLGIGKHRGYQVLRYRRFICSANVYPETSLLFRVQWLAADDYITG